MIDSNRFLLAGAALALSALVARGQSQEMRDYSAAYTARDNARVVRTQVQNAHGISRQHLDLVRSRVIDSQTWAAANRAAMGEVNYQTIMGHLATAQNHLGVGEGDYMVGEIARVQPDGLYAAGEHDFNTGSWIFARLNFEDAIYYYSHPYLPSNPYACFIAANNRAIDAQLAVNAANTVWP